MLHSKLTRCLATFFLLLTVLMLNVQPVLAASSMVTLTTTVSPSESGIVIPPAGVYPEGTPVTITATPYEGYKFDHREGDLSGSNNPSIITMNSNKTVSAIFDILPQYNLTATVAPPGGGSIIQAPPKPSGGYYEGTEVILGAIPDEGYEFDHWKVQYVTSSGATTANPLSITMYGPASATAFFVAVAVPQYSLTATVAPPGGGSIIQAPPKPSGGYYEGTEVILGAIPDEGYEFDHWKVQYVTSSGATTANPLSITMYGPASATAFFVAVAVPQYNLPVSVDPSGGGTISKDPSQPIGGYYKGTVVSLTANPAEGYEFDHWTHTKTLSNGEVRSGIRTANPLSITMYGPAQATAFFVAVAVPQYNLTATVAPPGGGSIIQAPPKPSGGYYEGTEVILGAIPDEGYEFDHWKVQYVTSSGATTANPLSITMYGPASATAFFVAVAVPQFTLPVSVNPSGGGTISKDPPQPTGGYYEGTVVSLTANPAEGYEFDHWKVQYVTSSGATNAGTSSDNPITIPMYGPASATAFFTAIPQYDLTATVAPPGGGSIKKAPPKPSGGYYEGTEVILGAIPDEGYEFDHWKVQYVTSSGATNAGTSSDNPITIPMYGPASATAFFTAIPQYSFSASVNPSGSGTITKDPSKPAGGYYEGTEVTLTANPAEGYEFDEWLIKRTMGGLAQIERTSTNPLTITMDCPTTATAYFVAVTVPQYNLPVSVDPSGGGTVTKDPSQPIGGYYEGTEVTLTPVPSEGYAFDQWGGDLTGNADPASIVMDDDKQVTAFFTFVDTVAPTADIVDILPDPRNSTVGLTEIVFSEPVSGVNINDLSLTLDGSAISLAGLTVNQISDNKYTLDLTSVTHRGGAYTLTLVAAGSGIVDNAGNPLTSDAVDSWFTTIPVVIHDTSDGDWQWDVVYSDPITITVQMTELDGDSLKNQVEEPKDVYLEYWDGSGFAIVTSDVLNDPTDNDKTLMFTFQVEELENIDVCAGDYPIRFRFDGDSAYEPIDQPGILSVFREIPSITDKDHEPDSWTWQVSYSDTLIINLQLTDNDGENLYHQADQSKTVYLERWGGANWLEFDSDILDDITNNDRVLQFVSDVDLIPGDYPIRFRFDGDCRYADFTQEGLVHILNQPPVAYDQSVTTFEDTAIAITLTASDTDSTVWGWDVLYPSNGTLSGGPPNLTYTPNANYNGVDSFTFKVNDGYDDSNTATVTIYIDPVNDPPSFAPGSDQVVDEDSGPQSDMWATQILPGPYNESSQQLEFIVTNDNNSLFSVQPVISVDGELTFTPAPDAHGSATVTVQLHDDGGTDNGGNDTSPARIFTITVVPVNDPPVADANGPYSGYEGSPVTLDGTASYDPDGTIVTCDWDFGDTRGGNGPAPEHVYLEDGIYTVTLTVTDNEGATDTATTTITVLNVAPVVEAGEDFEIPEGTKFRFMGSFIDPGLLDAHKVEWDFGDGGTAQGNLTPEYSYGDNGVYIVTLTVTDDEGGIGTGTLTVTVSNVSPVVNAGDDVTINEGDTVHFNGVFKDPGWLDTHTFEWDFGDGSPPVQGALTPTHTYTDDGVYTVTLTVNDDDGGRGTDTLVVTVLDLSPTADFKWSPEPQDEGAPVQFTDISSSYPDSIVAWEWDFAGLGSLSEQNPSFAFMDDGTYPVTLTVTDDDGSTDTIVHTVTIIDLGPTADFSWSPETQDEGSVVVFNDKSTSYPDSIIARSWDFGGLGSSNEQNPSFIFMDDGTYPVTLTVTDDDGSTDTISHMVTVQNVSPIVDAGPDLTQYWRLGVDFIGSYSDIGTQDTHTFEWDFGDGGTASTVTVSHIYEDTGIYTAILTVTDDDEGVGSDNTQVTVIKRTTSLDYTGDTSVTFGFATTLSAWLSDTVDSATAQLDGRNVAFTINGETYNAATDTSGIANIALSSPLLPGTYNITVGFVDDSHYLGSTDQAILTVTNTVGGKVTAGTLRSSNNSRGGFNVQSDSKGLKGELQFQNKSIKFHAHTMTALGISLDGTKAWFAGIGKDGETFIAYVEDNGEPGRNDIFQIWIDGVLQNGSGELTGGNVQIH